MKRKHETIKGHNISVWDDGEKVIDRYTVVYLDETDHGGKVQYLGMSAHPFPLRDSGNMVKWIYQPSPIGAVAGLS